MTCKICNNATEKRFEKLVLEKYSIAYFQCGSCDFIQTEEPFWLQEAYSNAITATDVGLISRNVLYSEIIPPFLELFSNELSDSFLDFGGGYGMFVRMMRDKGYNFFLEDRYAENLFAKYFELKNYSGSRFKALTSFEVFEHLVNPLEEISQMFKLSDNIIFSTELHSYPFQTTLDWWYFAPEHGQHIAFYSIKTLRKISELFDCNMYSNQANLHIFSKTGLSSDPFLKKIPASKKIISKCLIKLNKVLGATKEQNQRNTLLQKDFELYKGHLTKHHKKMQQ